jgi:NADPH:quinone reductase
MRAVTIKEPGGPEVLQIVERELPQNGDDALIRVMAVGVNRADVLQRLGRYPAPAGVSADVPGLEFAGIVEKAAHLGRFQVGDSVFALSAGATYQDYVRAKDSLLMKIPDGLSFVEAATIPESYITAFDAMCLQGALKPAQTVLVSAAASSVGIATAKLARLFHCRTIGTSRSQEKLNRLNGLFDHAILVSDGKFGKAVRELGGADLIIELVGGDYVEEDLEAVNPLGHIIVVGLLAGAKVQLTLGKLLAKRVTMRGTTLRARPLHEKVAVTRAFEEQILPHFASGKITVDLDSVYKLEQTQEAHQRMEQDLNIGKIVLDLS